MTCKDGVRLLAYTNPKDDRFAFEELLRKQLMSLLNERLERVRGCKNIK